MKKSVLKNQEEKINSVEEFLIVWSEPTYYDSHGLENFETILDKNRGFEEESILKIVRMKVGELERFEDFIVYRIN